MALIPKGLDSSIGRKLVMAVTGLGLLGFVVGHLLGNLLVFAGPDAINVYAAGIKAKPLLLWTARLGLLAILTGHVFMAFRLAIANRAAKGQGYETSHTNKASIPSLVMLVSGLAILAFVAFHLLHFTAWKIGPDHDAYVRYEDAQGRHDVYRMIYTSFTDPQFGLLYTGLYVAAMVGLAFHLAHAGTSVLQTFGIEHKNIAPVALAVALALSAGYVAIPVAIRLGCLPTPEVSHP